MCLLACSRVAFVLPIDSYCVYMWVLLDGHLGCLGSLGNDDGALVFLVFVHVSFMQACVLWLLLLLVWLML